jgi:amidophosphoribosyltransferase
MPFSSDSNYTTHMAERSADWIKQASRDLKMAQNAKELGFYEWACFIAQQSAEKAVKAVYQSQGGSALGHGIGSLLRGLRHEHIVIPDDLMRAAKILDGHYIPSRYPDGVVEGIPADHFTMEDADGAIRCAGEIVRFCQNLLA